MPYSLPPSQPASVVQQSLSPEANSSTPKPAKSGIGNLTTQKAEQLAVQERSASSAIQSSTSAGVLAPLETAPQQELAYPPTSVEIADVTSNPPVLSLVSRVADSTFLTNNFDLSQSKQARDATQRGQAQVRQSNSTEASIALDAKGDRLFRVHQALTSLGNSLIASGLDQLRLTSGLLPAQISSHSKPQPQLTAKLLKSISQTPAPASSPEDTVEEPIELTADRQEFNEQQQTFTASGNVIMRFRGAVLQTNQLRVNLRSRVAVAQGNISLTRGQQVLQGERLEYNFAQNRGSFQGARGTINIPTAARDISPDLPTDVSAGSESFAERAQRQPLQVQVTDAIQKLRFEAARIEFNAGGWQAQNIRITNDPFSPPELEVRAAKAALVQVSPQEDRVTTSRPRIVLDHGLSLPILKSQVKIDRQGRDPLRSALPRVGFDLNERGGLFLGRNFEFGTAEQTSLRVTPHFLLGRAFDTGINIVDPDLYGLSLRLRSVLGPRRLLTGFATLNSLDPSQLADSARARLTLRQPVGTHTLTLESAYRDRVFNGSLGEQTIQSSLGAVLASPVIPLAKTGLNLSYQIATQYFTANTALDSGNTDSLGRLQAIAALSRGFNLWQGQALPATAIGGLKYTPAPVVPYLQLLGGVTGVLNAYTNSDTQQILTGTIGVQGQIGHFSRRFLDYTGFNLSYSQVGLSGLSPFLFDRVVDRKVLSVGVLQQVYGPVRVGVQAALNLDTGNAFDTDYILDYSRRTYGFTLRYNPSREIASFNFRLSGFNWMGDAEPFDTEIRSVRNGVQRTNE